ncbi:hypothetical protein DY000_02030928 [Brassica cretica]|uniref:Jacalin-type lectin domain-containing protein n=1 Tax=Brassica cretica TaxID=69181 RepID=A0ABQ7DPB6_BRACR|nr:hypothetical protein DY000_02030928 [Brassica cretica]
MADNFEQLSDDALEAMQVDQISERRTLGKRKEKHVTTIMRMNTKSNDNLHGSYAVDTELPETRSDEYDEDYHREKNIEYHGLAMDERGLLHTSSADVKPTIDSSNNPSIVIRYKHLSEEHLNNNTDYDLIPDEFGIFRDSAGRARGMDGSILNVSKEDFAEIFAMHGSGLFC